MDRFLSCIENPAGLTLVCLLLALWIVYIARRISGELPTYSQNLFQCVLRPVLTMVIFGITLPGFILVCATAAIEQGIRGAFQAFVIGCVFVLSCLTGSTLAAMDNIRQYKGEVFASTKKFVGGKEFMTNMQGKHVLLEPYHVSNLGKAGHIPQFSVLFVSSRPQKVDQGMQVNGVLYNLAGQIVDKQFSAIFPDATTFQECGRKQKLLA